MNNAMLFMPEKISRVILLATLACVVTGAGMLAFPVSSHPMEPIQVVETCTRCHNIDRICSHLGRGEDYWTLVLPRMASYGASVDLGQVADMVGILTAETAAMSLGCEGAQSEGASGSKPFVAYLHPTLMSLVFFLALWVAWQGVNRARFAHFRHKVKFNWKGHVRFGSVVLIAWLGGMAAGSIVTQSMFGGLGATGAHRTTAMAMVPLILFGGVSGFYLNRWKKPRKVLPIMHGIANLVSLLLAAGQFVSGIGFLW